MLVLDELVDVVRGCAPVDGEGVAEQYLVGVGAVSVVRGGTVCSPSLTRGDGGGCAFHGAGKLVGTLSGGACVIPTGKSEDVEIARSEHDSLRFVHFAWEQALGVVRARRLGGRGECCPPRSVSGAPR